ncbi:DUF1648 domain-containing protein [Pseudactinotalea sp. Z1732]|uniref:DUF1648 domain-containing protein n=1 Tax=Micrococcales TaxID=85006 RepID=UPI003C7ABE18
MTAEPTSNGTVSRFGLVTILIPAMLTAAAVIVQVAIAPALPNPVAIHWDAAGAPDGFAPLWTVIAVTVLTGFGVPALMGLSALPGLKLGDQGVTYRFLGATAAGLSAMLTVLSTWSLMVQRGLDDATQVATITPAVLISSLVGLAAGAGGWFAQPHMPAVTKPERSSEPLDLAEGEDVAWLRVTTLGGSGMGILAVSLVALLLGTIAAWLIPTDPTMPWILTGTLAILMVAAAVTGAFRVRAGRDGLTVTSLVGLPRLRVPLADIDSVGVVDVNPAGEFGGVGLRFVPGRFGVVLRTGEAIQVTRRNGRQFVVTVDDAATAVAVLAAYRVRSRADTRENG